MGSHERAYQDEANNVTYQRCQFAYEYVKPFIIGKDVLDVGCGMAYGTALMAQSAKKITGIDYDQETVADNRQRLASVTNLDFKQGDVPPLPFPDQSFDVVTAFHFIEHLHERKEFLKEILRVLRPGGSLIVSTPNAKKSLARNPFHVHEYTVDEMKDEIASLTKNYELKGLNGNQVVNDYYKENEKFVRMILKWDVLKLHRVLPASLLTKPYNWITSLMRNKLKEKVSQTSNITTKDFFLQTENLDETWDLFLIASK